MPIMVIELRVPPSDLRRSELLLRPWRATDMAALVAEMGREYPTAGLRANGADWPDRPGRTGPRDEEEAVDWLASQDFGWRNGDWLTFAVLERAVPIGHVGLKNRDDVERIGERETAEISYWIAAGARGRGVAPAAVRAVTAWVFEMFAARRLRQIMLVHDVDNPASCRVADKAGYPFREFSPANPPYWSTDGHVHMRLAS